MKNNLNHAVMAKKQYVAPLSEIMLLSAQLLDGEHAFSLVVSGPSNPGSAPKRRTEVF